MDLDSLLADLELTASGNTKPTEATEAKPTTPPPPPTPTEPAPPPPPPVQQQPQQTPVQQSVAFEDLDGLMADLDSVTKPQVAQVLPSTNKEAAIDDLDALVDSLDATAQEAIAAQSKGTQKPQQEQQPPPQQQPQAANIDALDDLLGQLNSAVPEPSAEVRATEPQQQNSPQQQMPPMAVAPSHASTAQQRQPKDELDSLLTNLNSEMSRIDANAPASRGVCGRCGKAITGEVIQAMGKMWHPEHFTCASCKQPLGTSTFFESDGQPHCERCWKALFCPRCSYCDQPITDRCISALGKKWHPEHFLCCVCLQPLDGGFMERDGKPYCEKHYYESFSAKCAACGQPIRGECINALGQKWHPEHFVCFYCHKPFNGGAFFEYQGKPYCEVHYYQMTGSLCAGCGKPVGSNSISALGKKWHPEHFVCAFCNNPLSGGSFKEQGGKAYCNACHAKLFG